MYRDGKRLPLAPHKAAVALSRYADDGLNGGSLLKTLKAVTGGEDSRDCLRRLAALIDMERCRIVQDECGTWECTNCGAAIDWDAGDEAPNCAFCPNCGAEVDTDG